LFRGLESEVEQQWVMEGDKDLASGGGWPNYGWEKVGCVEGWWCDRWGLSGDG